MKKLLISVLAACAFATGSALASTPYFKSNATSTAALVSAVPAKLAAYNISNPNGAVVYVQFFDAAATSSVTPGSTAPYFVLAVPAYGVTDGVTSQPPVFVSGIVIVVATTATGSGAPSSACPVTLLVQ